MNFWYSSCLRRRAEAKREREKKGGREGGGVRCQCLNDTWLPKALSENVCLPADERIRQDERNELHLMRQTRGCVLGVGMKIKGNENKN